MANLGFEIKPCVLWTPETLHEAEAGQPGRNRANTPGRHSQPKRDGASANRSPSSYSNFCNPLYHPRTQGWKGTWRQSCLTTSVFNFILSPLVLRSIPVSKRTSGLLLLSVSSAASTLVSSRQTQRVRHFSLLIFACPLMTGLWVILFACSYPWQWLGEEGAGAFLGWGGPCDHLG